MPRYRFWIYPKDADGRPLEDVILKAAEENITILTRYREKEIGCESMINTLLQSVVEAASKAHRRRAIQNPIAYLRSAYQHRADKLLDRQKRIVGIDSAWLELPRMVWSVSLEEDIHRRLVLEKILRVMDRDMCQVARLLLAGYSVNEIGRTLSKDPRRLYFRYRRELQKALKKILGPAAIPSHGRGGSRR
jgi:hypothetical protein